MLAWECVTVSSVLVKQLFVGSKGAWVVHRTDLIFLVLMNDNMAKPSIHAMVLIVTLVAM